MGAARVIPDCVRVAALDRFVRRGPMSTSALFRGNVSTLTPPGFAPRGILPIRGAAAPFMFGRFKGVVLRRGEIEIPPLKRVFGSFLHEQKGTLA